MIRAATSQDEPAIRACAEAAYARYIPRIGRKPAPLLADYTAHITAGQVFLAEQGGLLGFVVFYPDGEYMLLENVAVAPEAAGQGIARR